MNDEVFDWDSEIEADSEFTVLPEGTYDFEVIKFERGQHNGSEKLSPCKKAILTIRLTNGDKSTTVTHNLFLHSKCEGMLSAFFVSIGQKKHGEKVRMNWQQVTGAKGRCKVGIKTYNDNQYNEIKRFLEPEKTQVPSYSGF